MGHFRDLHYSSTTNVAVLLSLLPSLLVHADLLRAELE